MRDVADGSRQREVKTSSDPFLASRLGQPEGAIAMPSRIARSETARSRSILSGPAEWLRSRRGVAEVDHLVAAILASVADSADSPKDPPTA
jgi:hypothetical protein